MQQGQVVAATEEAHGTRHLHLKATLQIKGHTWLTARCSGPGFTGVPHHDGWRRGLMAHTSPVYVAVGGKYELFDLLDFGQSLDRQ